MDKTSFNFLKKPIYMYGIVCLKTPDHRTWHLLVNIDRKALSITVKSTFTIKAVYVSIILQLATPHRHRFYS